MKSTLVASIVLFIVSICAASAGIILLRRSIYHDANSSSDCSNKFEGSFSIDGSGDKPTIMYKNGRLVVQGDIACGVWKDGSCYKGKVTDVKSNPKSNQDGNIPVAEDDITCTKKSNTLVVALFVGSGLCFLVAAILLVIAMVKHARSK